MQVIIPKTITLHATNVPASEVALWSDLTTYAKGEQVLITDNDRPRIYASRVADNTDRYPPDHLEETELDDGTELPAQWKDLGPTNRWAMFDTYISTATSQAETIEVTIDASRCDSLALFGLYAAQVDIELTNDATETVVHTDSASLRQDSSASWSDYFFGDFDWRTTWVFKFPVYYEARLKITITANTGEDAQCGQCVIGRSRYIGESQWGPALGILDYSKKDMKENGTIEELLPGKYAARHSIDLSLDTGAVSKIFSMLSALRATPCVWAGNNDASNYEALTVFGIFRDVQVVLPGPALSQCNLDIEGLI
jgi:hypothetical protein